MKYYAIYQFYVNGYGEEKELLVGFAQGESDENAKQNYLNTTYPDNSDKQEFIKGYLSAYRCREELSKERPLLAAIEENKKRLGIWA